MGVATPPLGRSSCRDRTPGLKLVQPERSNAAGFAQPGQNQHVVGQIPQGWHSGSGTIITGAAASKAEAVAIAKYPSGTVNRVLKLSDGSYAVHMIKISWPHHVFVSANFEVTGAVG